MVRNYLFIEGTNDTSNGDLRKGFRILFEKKVQGKMPTISMGDGKSQVIRKFLNSRNSKLLCDLDAHGNNVDNDLESNSLLEQRTNVFYMIQEMEAWFISQPEILNKFYGENIADRLAKKHGSEFGEPDKELQRITKNTRKGTYHKVKHGAEILELLDADKLCQDFPDFKRLIDALKA